MVIKDCDAEALAPPLSYAWPKEKEMSISFVGMVIIGSLISLGLLLTALSLGVATSMRLLPLLLAAALAVPLLFGGRLSFNLLQVAPYAVGLLALLLTRRFGWGLLAGVLVAALTYGA